MNYVNSSRIAITVKPIDAINNINTLKTNFWTGAAEIETGMNERPEAIMKEWVHN